MGHTSRVARPILAGVLKIGARFFRPAARATTAPTRGLSSTSVTKDAVSHRCAHADPTWTVGIGAMSFTAQLLRLYVMMLMSQGAIESVNMRLLPKRDTT